MNAFTAIRLQGISYAFGSHTVLDDIDLTIDAGSVVALLGPSGCGKSTLLEMIGAILRPGMVFQDYALWPHMTVAQNVAFPLKMRNVPRAERDARVAKALARVGLEAFADRKPSGLSGGQQQRVALARAIVGEPRVLLFDEPLSNLDSELRESLCTEMARLLRQLGTTAVYVTHDRREAEILADRIVHLSAGSIAAVRAVTPSSGEFA